MATQRMPAEQGGITVWKPVWRIAKGVKGENETWNHFIGRLLIAADPETLNETRVETMQQTWRPIVQEAGERHDVLTDTILEELEAHADTANRASPAEPTRSKEQTRLTDGGQS